MRLAQQQPSELARAVQTRLEGPLFERLTA
jgi:hypothetical protein